jgi:SAM-dependent methyltransferase
MHYFDGNTASTATLLRRQHCFEGNTTSGEHMSDNDQPTTSAAPTGTPQANPLSVPDAWNGVSAGYAADLAPFFERFAADALAIADVGERDIVLDVACGPGTLALLAAERAERVVVLDFAEEMIGMLRRRAADSGMSNVEPVVGDGQALPFDDASFDAAFSMFGLIFFPDRDAGFRELHRALRRGGRAVVSSWPPMTTIPLLAATFEALGELVPDLPRGGTLPLSTPDELSAAMSAAGFEDVEVHTRSHGIEWDSIDEYGRWSISASAPMVLLRRRLGEEEWKRVYDGVSERLRQRFGTGSLSAEWVAYLGFGRR